MKEKYSWVSTFGFALNGIWQTVKKERNIKVHLLVALTVLVLGFIFGVNKNEWLALILIICLILMAEIFNSAIEEICDLLKEKLHLDYQVTSNIRDVSAGAVLVLAIGSIILGFIIFLPYMYHWFK